MNKRTVLTLALTTLFSGGQLSSPVQYGFLKRELEDLSEKGMTYRFLDNETVEVKQEWSGFSRVFKTVGPSEAQIRAWADTHGVPVLTIDPNTIDTSRFSGWYRYWTTVPLSNGFGSPLVVGDLDNNGKPEVYGIYKDYRSDFESHIYEVDSSGNHTLLFNYVPRLGPSRQFTNIDNNSLIEINFAFGSAEYLFEQPATNALPTSFKLKVFRDSLYGSVFTGVLFKDLDGNDLTDFVNTGGIPDSASGQPLRKVFVREYDSTQNSFATVWSSQFDQPLGNYGGFTAGDFDGDGKQEFQCTELMGKVYVVESTGIHSYARTWSDSTPYVNLFYQTSGDIDRDGKGEFYVGATMSNGNWTTMYEADSNDHYSPRFIFHLLSGGSLDEPTYLTPDVDLDGKPELLILSGADLYIFKSDGNDSFYLWYYRYFTAKESIQFYNFNHDGKLDFILSRARVDSLGRGAHFADVYLAQGFTGVESDQAEPPNEFSIAPNYPNPFNPSTTIKYDLPEPAHVSLVVYDVLGRKVAELVNGTKEAGYHSATWNASGVASGMYFGRFTATDESGNVKLSKVNKLLLTK